MRIQIFAANWKMFKTTAEAESFCQQLVNLPRVPGNEIVLFPPFTALATVKSLMTGRGVSWGAQNCHPKDNGAFTGEISCAMLKDLGCTWVLCGHSERRHVFKESDDFIAEKVLAVLKSGMKANLCVGETLEQRQAGQTEAVVSAQVRSGLARVTPDQLDAMCISYEPVWAIGTGQNASGQQAQEVCGFIRRLVADQYSQPKADALRILYGGSVKPENIGEYTHQKDIDGGLVGGASLVAESFHQIVTRGSD
jgi:triosephosphate isomerase (TIM)